MMKSVLVVLHRSVDPLSVQRIVVEFDFPQPQLSFVIASRKKRTDEINHGQDCRHAARDPGKEEQVEKISRHGDRREENQSEYVAEIDASSLPFINVLYVLFLQSESNGREIVRGRGVIRMRKVGLHNFSSFFYYIPIFSQCQAVKQKNMSMFP